MDSGFHYSAEAAASLRRNDGFGWKEETTTGGTPVPLVMQILLRYWVLMRLGMSPIPYTQK